MIKISLLLFILSLKIMTSAQYYLPVATYNRSDIKSIELTEIGNFGEIRKPRPNIPRHLHTGIDIKRPSKNYINEPIFPILEGVVVSIRDDGPYAQIIIYHEYYDEELWTVYEHISGIMCHLNDKVNPELPIARFMNTKELNKFGWQFDHVHLEIMKRPPIKTKPTTDKPYRYYTTYWLSCFNWDDLLKYYYNPLKTFEKGL